MSDRSSHRAPGTALAYRPVSDDAHPVAAQAVVTLSDPDRDDLDMVSHG